MSKLQADILDFLWSNGSSDRQEICDDLDTIEHNNKIPHWTIIIIKTPVIKRLLIRQIGQT